jgi:hypothetical protein
MMRVSSPWHHARRRSERRAGSFLRQHTGAAALCRHLHRVPGAGLLRSWGLLPFGTGSSGIALAVMALTFVTALITAHHCGFAVVFIAPLTMLPAKAAAPARARRHPEPGALFRHVTRLSSQPRE